MTLSNLGSIQIFKDDPRVEKVLRGIVVEKRDASVVAGIAKAGPNLFQAAPPLAVMLDIIPARSPVRELCHTFKVDLHGRSGDRAARHP